MLAREWVINDFRGNRLFAAAGLSNLAVYCMTFAYK
jgi:hypothetical protein